MDLNQEKQKYYDAWARMMITIWQDKIINLGIRDSGDLLTSFTSELHMQSNGDVGKITHTYMLYGRMVDMGVGRGTHFGDVESTRKQKQWYNKFYYHSVKVLTEKTAGLYGEQFQAIISGALNF